MSQVKVLPLGDRLLVRQDEGPQMSTGGILLPDSAKEAPQWGEVIRVGSGKKLDNGDVCALSVKEGDKVIFGKYSGTKITLEAEEYLFLREEDVMGVLEK